MRASGFDWLLTNLRAMFSPSGLYYLPRDEALLRLRSLTGQDFGHDAARWAEYGRRKNLCLIRWETSWCLPWPLPTLSALHGWLWCYHGEWSRANRRSPLWVLLLQRPSVLGTDRREASTCTPLPSNTTGNCCGKTAPA